MTKIYIVRHAEAEGNIFRRIHGSYDSRVTYNGRRQIGALKKRFLNVPLDAVYSSDLYRAAETAKALSEPKGLPLRRDPRFRETHLGRWEDLPFGFLDTFEPDQMRKFGKAPEEWRIDGAETFDAYTRRFIDGLVEVAGAHEGGAAAIVTHGCVCSGTFRRLFGTGPLDGLRCDNTGVSLLTWDRGKFNVDYLYDNSHLPEALSTVARQNWWRGTRDFNLWFRDAAAADAALFDPDLRPDAGDAVRIAMLVDQPIGYLSFRKSGGTGTLSTIYLRPEKRHLRMGDQLFGEAVCRLRADGIQTLQIGVPTLNTDALSFFTRMNCKVTQMDDAYTVFLY